MINKDIYLMVKKLAVVGSCKGNRPDVRMPKMCFQGDWLKDMGFPIGALVDVESDYQSIVLKLRGSEQVKSLKPLFFRSSQGLLKVTYCKAREKQYPALTVQGFWLQPLGFAIGNLIVVEAEEGVITIKPFTPKNQGGAACS